MRKLPLIAAVVCMSARADATETGIDIGWVVADGRVVDASLPEVDAIGVGWVRINFRLDAWSSPDDATPHGPDNLTWYAAYDRVVDAYIARGYQVYGLLNDEALSSPAAHGSDAWIADFVANSVRIVDHFKDRVRVYEVINEPNDFAGGTSARFSARQFAKILADTYAAVKREHAADRCWQVDLVSGPLFSFDDTTAADYLAATYAAFPAGSHPLDGVGYHMYVAQGADSPTSDVRTLMLRNLDGVRGVVLANEGAAKPLWVSEYGFRADVLGDAGQAERMDTAFGAMRDFGDVALAVYFTLQDFPGNAWGVLDDAGHARTSATQLAQLSAANRPAHGAAIVSVEATPLVAGADGEVVVTVENRGATAWSDGIRLGAAAGCPDAAATNGIAWAPVAGYATSLTDARVYLPADVPPGGSVAIHVPVHAPDQPGTYRFAARMVHEGVTWFGATASAEITVAPANGGSGTSPGESGCSTSPGAGFAVLLIVLGLRRRSQ